MKIHKEGYVTIILSFVTLLAIALSMHFFIKDFILLKTILYVIFVFLFLLIVYFFRSPKRDMNHSHDYIISPADGKIVVIEEVTANEFLTDKRIQVSIFMSPLNVHCNRYPYSGIVRYVKYHSGSYFVAWHPKSSEENERTTVVIEDAKNRFILIRQIAGALARRIICNATLNESVVQGQELGFIKFGSRVDLLLPPDIKLNVKLGQAVKAGKTIIAEFNK